MKYLLPLLLALCTAGTIAAQGVNVRGTVTDALDGGPLPGAHIVLSGSDQQADFTQVSDYEGRFVLESVSVGTYQLSISYIGFQTVERTVEVGLRDYELPTISLREGVELEQVQVTAQVVPVQQIGDTTQFNADAYTTMPDADAQDLIEKMPTVVVSNGEVQAQGEKVEQVLVDGKRFFGDDPTAALRNLPAEVIDKIQIFDQQSEQAQFTGFDDGETILTINIVTRITMRNGQFGSFYGGYGTEGTYKLGGNLNLFNDDQRISIIGMSNNINDQNFSSDDLLGVMSGSGGSGRGRRRGGGSGGGESGGTLPSDFMVSQRDGITNSDAIGFNYSNEWGEKVKVTASYFYNRSDNLSDQLSDQQFFSAVGTLSEIYDEGNSTSSINQNHRFNLRLDYAIDERNSLLWRPSLRWQGSDGQELTLGQSLLGEQLLSEANNQFSADLSALNLNNKLLWRHKFNRDRRTLSVNLSGGYAPEAGESYLLSQGILLMNGADTSTLDQFATLDANSWNTSADVQFTEPLGQNGMLLFNYKASYQQEESEVETFDYNSDSESYDLLNDELTNVFSNDYFTQRMGFGYNMRAGALLLTLRADVQKADLLNEQTFPAIPSTDDTFWNVLPMARLRLNLSRSENVNLMYRSGTDLPSIDELQEVVDLSNPLQWEVGNAELVPSYQHRLLAQYRKTNTEKSSVFFAMLGGTYAQNYVASATYLAGSEHPVLTEYGVSAGSQLTQPVNLNGYWNMRSFMTYGFPVSFLQSNLNVDLTSGYTKTPGLVNEELLYSSNTNAGLGLTLSSNISERIDFTLSSRSNYYWVDNTLTSSGNDNYFNQNSRVRLNWLATDNLIFRTDLTHQLYQGLGEEFDQNYLLWNMSIGHKLFKDNRGEISLSVFDLLNQNNSISRTVTETYIENVQTNVLQRYLMLNFKYDLRSFGGATEMPSQIGFPGFPPPPPHG